MDTSTTRRLLTHFQGIASGIVLSLGLLAGVFGGVSPVRAASGDTWHEEALLHDGRTIVAERYVRRGGRAEIGQSGAYVEQQLNFSEPTTGKTYRWNDGYSPDLGMANFLLLELHVVDQVPYVVATPMGCQSYNKWGRPNPPYVIFKAQGNQWERIDVAGLPAVAQSANLLHSAPDDWIRRHKTQRATSHQIQAENATNQPQYRSILREPVSSDAICRLQFTNGKGRWLGADWFSEEPNMASCKRVCEQKNFAADTCPCKQFFKEE